MWILTKFYPTLHCHCYLYTITVILFSKYILVFSKYNIYAITEYQLSRLFLIKWINAITMQSLLISLMFFVYFCYFLYSQFFSSFSFLLFLSSVWSALLINSIWFFCLHYWKCSDIAPSLPLLSFKPLSYLFLFSLAILYLTKYKFNLI